ncbi:hypothetical protein [Ensifer sp. LCM 4579]|uniref:hypothetical protein n=1 Tax=Ensifer sp. LCM 4579 TaxID=1848292 RepID=UPI0008D994AF|nr:hypothetical protein [Ensifer sp. LCM 4579]OHV81793.1 hypothetical protein LCM4579_18525 [Ensifer sp. LCM 4579]
MICAFRCVCRRALRIALLIGAFASGIAAESGAAAAQQNPAERDRKIAAFIARQDEMSGLSAPSGRQVSTDYVDLNGDGRQEALVVLNSSQDCGAMGCPGFVLVLTGGQARSIGDFIVRDLSVQSTMTNGWKDLLLNGHRMRFLGGSYSKAGGDAGRAVTGDGSRGCRPGRTSQSLDRTRDHEA